MKYSSKQLKTATTTGIEKAKHVEQMAKYWKVKSILLFQFVFGGLGLISSIPAFLPLFFPTCKKSVFLFPAISPLL